MKSKAQRNFLLLVILIGSFSSYAQGAWPHGGLDEPASCLACHSVHEAVAPTLLKSKELCLNCHGFQPPAGMWPGFDGFEASAHAGLCQECHHPHRVSAELGAELCFSCHDLLAQEFAKSQTMEEETAVPSRHHVDGKEARVGCKDCHNPHLVQQREDRYEPRVTDPANPLNAIYLSDRMVINNFCIRCHAGGHREAPDILAEIRGEGLNSYFYTIEDGRSLHQVHLTQTHKQNCLLCHSPHATLGSDGINRGRLLYNVRINSFAEGYPGYNSCITQCHGSRCGACHPKPPF